MTRLLLRAAVVILAALGGVAAIDACQAPPARAEALAPSTSSDARPAAPDTTITPALIALGDSIFRGRVAGGTCVACHGPAAKGIPGLAPDLTDSRWLHGDGTLAFLMRTIESGVPRPKEAAAAMPPGGGSRLTPEQLRAVAAYVYSLSHPEVRRAP